MDENKNYCVVVNIGSCGARPWTAGNDLDFHERVLEGAENLTHQEAQEAADEWRLWCEGIAEARR